MLSFSIDSSSVFISDHKITEQIRMINGAIWYFTSLVNTHTQKKRFLIMNFVSWKLKKKITIDMNGLLDGRKVGSGEEVDMIIAYAIAN